MLAKSRRTTAELDALAASVEKALGEAAPTNGRVYRWTAADSARLRAIPAIGPGVTGAIVGDHPAR